MMRITTNGVLRGYRSSLMRSSNNLDMARNKVLTQRNFNSFAEDPASATLAFQLRRSASAVRDQYTNSDAVSKKYDQAFSSMMTVIDKTGNQAKDAITSGLSDEKGSSRKQLGASLQAMAKTMMQEMNVKYGTSFVFAGSDGGTVPFSWGSNGELLYRGIDVNTQDADELARLKQMTEESVYIDVGYGLQEDPKTGNLIGASAANSSISGVKFLGYGMDAEGLPNNFVSIVKELGDIYARCDSSTGEWDSPADEARATALNDKFVKVHTALISEHVELDVQAKALGENSKRLDETHDMLNEQFLAIEQVNLADAISSFSWAQYCYNSALKVGNSILGQSLIDYMR